MVDQNELQKSPVPKRDLPADEKLMEEKLAPPQIVINMEPTLTPAASIRSLKKKKSKLSLNDADAERERQIKEKKAKMNIDVMAMGHRLKIRKELHNRLTLISDIMTGLGLLGLILMVVANELTFNRQDNRDSVASWFVKLLISISTGILLGLVLYYHQLDLKLYCAQNALHDWRVGLTPKKILLIISELIVCAIHPMPRAYPSSNDSSITGEKHPLSYTAVDVGLGFPMFLRLYLVGRSILFHSHLVRDASLQSLGYLNHVSITFFFLMKTSLEQFPIRSLCIFQTMCFFIGSWCLRACNYTSDGNHFAIGDSMWLYIVTFCTIGYGDLYPSSTCGRAIAGMVGIVGILSSALLIAVVAQKLVLRREEKYVHTFVLNIELAKARKHHAANIIKFAILAWYLKHKNRRGSFKYLQTQRKLFIEIFNLQQVKRAQRGLVDHCVGLHELMTVQRTTGDQVEDNGSQILSLQSQMVQVEQQMFQFHQTLQTMQQTLTILVEKSPTQ